MRCWSGVPSQGTFGKVRMVTHEESGEKFAMKVTLQTHSVGQRHV
jgi:hypothetical protein